MSFKWVLTALLLFCALPAHAQLSGQFGGGASPNGGTPGGAAGGALAGSYPNPTIAAGVITPVFGTYTIFPATSAACTTYAPTGTSFYCARNNLTGAFDYESADAAVVINDALVAQTTVGGTLFFKMGVYNLNSFTSETASGCSTFTSDSKPLQWAIGIPANMASLATGVTWQFIGEGVPPLEGEGTAATANQNGVILNVTSTAITGATSGAFLVGLFQRPIASCALNYGLGGNVSNYFSMENIDVRFPTNQRGNEAGIAPWFAVQEHLVNDSADFNLSPTALAGTAPVAGTYGSFGITTSVAGAGPQYQESVLASGWYTGFDWDSEDLVVKSAIGFYNNTIGEVGRATASIYHPVEIDFLIDAENLNGLLLGPFMLQGSRLDIQELDMEFGSSGWYARTAAAMVETNPGYTSGIITYSTILQGSGVTAETPDATLFTSGGGSFQSFEGTRPPNIALLPMSDTFTRANNTAALALGPAWSQVAGTGNGSWTIASNAAVPLQSSASASAAYYAAQTQVNNDQFAQITGSALVAASFWGVGIRFQTAALVSAPTGYLCASTGTGTIQVYKGTAGSFSTLGTAPAYTNTSGDIMYFAGYGSMLVCSVYRSGSLVAQSIQSDATYTGGAPWIYGYKNAGASGPSLTNFVGGSLPNVNNTSSIYTQPNFWTGTQTFTPGLTLGVVGTTSGVLTMAGATSGTATLTAPAVSGTTTNPLASSNDLSMPDLQLTGSAPAITAPGTTPYINASAPVEQRKQCSFALTTSTLTLALSPVNLCTITLPNAAVVWRVNCQGGWSVTAGTTPTFAVGNNWAQTPSGVGADANIGTTNAGVAVEGYTASTSNGNIVATGSLTTSATIFPVTWWTTFTGSATSGAYHPTASLTGTSATGTLVGFCTIQ